MEYIFPALCFLAAIPDCHLRDLQRFPRAVALDSCKFAAEHVEWIERQMEMSTWSRWELDQQLTEARWHHQAWKYLYQAHMMDEYHAPGARWQLEWLREHIGNESFDAGRMPAPVPVRWFVPMFR